jgi:hypothetical protein
MVVSNDITTSNKLYYDITQLAHWNGKITGIPRVIDELARRYYIQSQSGHRQVVFVTWVKELGALCEVDFEQTIIRRNGVVYRKVSEGADTSLETREHYAAQPSSGQSPYIRLVKKVAKKSLAVSGRFSPKAAAIVENRARKMVTAGYKRMDIHPGDLLFIPWGEWWDQNFTDYVVDCHGQGAKIVQFIHDIAPTTQPQFFERVAVSPAVYNTQVVPIASLVLTNSQHSKRELTAWLKGQKLTVPRIEVIRLGDNLDVANPTRPTDPQFVAAKLKGNDYIMAVGTIEAKKNHQLFYYVYKLAKARGITLPKLVIVGRLGWHTEVVHDMMTHDPEVKDSFVFMLNTDDEQMSWLYDHCMFSILASFDEGWGIPIAESLARGVPCLCSNTSSMVEIAEGIVDHFSPASSDECLAGIERLLDPKYLNDARQKAKRYRPHTWDEAFNEADTYVKEIK